MKLLPYSIVGSIFFAGTLTAYAAEQIHWPLETVDSTEIVLRGRATAKPDSVGNCLVLDGDSLVEAKLPESATPRDEYTLTVWVNPYTLHHNQQMIAAKNRYSLNESEWSVMVDHDRRIRCDVSRKKWKTVDGPQPKPGHWIPGCVVMMQRRAELFVNGSLAGKIKLHHPVDSTVAPLTFGGVNDKGNIRQGCPAPSTKRHYFREHSRQTRSRRCIDR